MAALTGTLRALLVAVHALRVLRVTFCALRVTLCAVLAWPSLALGHRLDEMLQATLVVIEPDEIRLRIHLTPGVEVAGLVLAQIDRDRDDTISEGEASVYVQALRQDLKVAIDGRVVALRSTASVFPPPEVLRTGSGIIRIEYAAPVHRLAAGPHRLEFSNRHLPAISVYLLNAARPRPGAVQILAQTRTNDQHAGAIEFSVPPPRIRTNPLDTQPLSEP